MNYLKALGDRFALHAKREKEKSEAAAAEDARVAQENAEYVAGLQELMQTLPYSGQGWE